MKVSYSFPLREENPYGFQWCVSSPILFGQSQSPLGGNAKTNTLPTAFILITV